MSCSVCLVEPARYTCPKCQKKTCSLACVKMHKVQDNCSGTASATASYLAREELKAADTPDGSNLLVQRDYNFLLGMNRQLELMKRDGKQKNKRTLAPTHSYNNQTHNRKQQRSDSQPHVIRRGVRCALLPKGMQRAVQNKSRWDKNLDLFVWSIEWCILSPEGTIELYHTSHRNKETDSLAECVGKIVQGKCNELFDSSPSPEGRDLSVDQAPQNCITTRDNSDAIPVQESQDIGTQTDLSITNTPTGPQQQETIKQVKLDWILSLHLQFYIKWYSRDFEIFGDSKKLIQLDPTISIGELFRDKVVVEYPTIYISQEGSPLCNGFSLIDQKHRMKPQATSSGESSPTSSEDNSCNSSSSSDSDEEPQEVSSKTVSVPRNDSSLPSTNNAPVEPNQASGNEVNSDDDDDEDDYTPGISLDFLAD
ncbi:Bcd1p LALA0_S09e01992g [Lachancea lanzarotensis]|uniref:LALA0S09e01992g1_1 n=1 Tax=Lachancea lanzarotensis TaxID=1245769 RepID=A0A0C7NBH5_9SACH|nr:uncharacterized protein LALA0_S09e01992g [Lachancea lanzarotensis]CEP63765.1 LALA0S09e01992g1_1 [Lachancea lanzarotensis]